VKTTLFGLGEHSSLRRFGHCNLLSPLLPPPPAVLAVWI